MLEAPTEDEGEKCTELRQVARSKGWRLDWCGWVKNALRFVQKARCLFRRLDLYILDCLQMSEVF